MRREIAGLRSELRAEQTKSGRLADDLALCQRDRREDKAHAARQHQIDGQEIARLQDALKAWEARWANAHRIDVPAPRDLRPADERPTVPTDVSSVRPVHRVIPITERPDAANPANIPAA
jgi:hypothetical protein